MHNKAFKSLRSDAHKAARRLTGRWATNPEGMKLTHLVGGPGNIEPGY